MRDGVTTPATSSDSLKATVEYALKREDLGGPFRDLPQGFEVVAPSDRL